jgi:hypothetical protein
LVVPSCGALLVPEGLVAPAGPAAVPVAADGCVAGVAVSPDGGFWVPGLGTVARPVARAGAAPEPGLFPAPGVPGPVSGDVVPPAGPAGGAGFGVPVEPVCAFAAATVAGVAFGVPGLPVAADAVRSADPGVLPVVPGGGDAAPGATGDEEPLVTVVREPGPGVTVLWVGFTA